MRHKNADKSLQNSFRDGISEGTVAVFHNLHGCDALKGADQVFLNVIKQIHYVDEDDIQFFKIFSLLYGV